MFYEPKPGVKPAGLPHDPFKSLVVPRPIGWISTVDPDGVVNLAPYSYFNAVSSEPPIVLFASNHARSDDRRKDSHRNAERTGGFVVNLATYDLREQMNASSADVPPEVDEMALAGLTAVPSRLVKAPRVAEAPVHLECRYMQTVQLPSWNPKVSNAIVIGEVIGVHIADEFIAGGRVDVGKLRPIARLGYMDYAVVDTIFSLDRPR